MNATAYVGIWDAYAYSDKFRKHRIKEEENQKTKNKKRLESKKQPEVGNSTIMKKINIIRERYDNLLLTKFLGERFQRLKIFVDNQWSMKKEDTIPFYSNKDLKKKITIKRLEKITNPPVEIKQNCGKGISQKIGVFVVVEKYYASFEYLGKRYNYYDKSFWFCDVNGDELNVSKSKIESWYQDSNNTGILEGWMKNQRDPWAKIYYLFFRNREFEEIKALF